MRFRRENLFYPKTPLPIASNPSVSGEMSQMNSSLSILIVDDDMPTRLWLMNQAQVYASHVYVAKNVEEALSLSETRFFDLVLMDCCLSAVDDGLELTRTLRQTNPLTQMVIIGMTARVGGLELHRGTAAGMNECVIKPLSPEKLKRLIAHHFSFKKIAFRSLPFAMDESFLRAIWENNIADMKAIEEALVAGDALKIAYFAHRLSGAASVAGRVGVARRALSLEAACHYFPLRVAHVLPYVGRLKQGLLVFNRDIAEQLRKSAAQALLARDIPLISAEVN